MEERCIHAVLRRLIAASEEGRIVFRHAAETTDRSDYRVLFAFYSAQRAAFADALCRMVEEHGGALKRRRAVHVSVLPDGDECLSECAREELHALREFRKALDHPLPHDLQTEIGAQSLEVKAALDRVRFLSRRIKIRRYENPKTALRSSSRA